MTLYGYPIKLDSGKYQYGTPGIINSVSNYNFSMSTGDGQGFSGGPIIQYPKNSCVGVYFGVVDGLPTGVRLKSNMIDIIKSYINK